MIGRDLDLELQLAVGVEASQRALDGRHGWRDRHARARHVEGRGGTRPGQVVVDLLAHRRNLASHRGGELGGAVGGEPIDLVGQDAQRCLQPVRQIAGLGTAAGHDLFVALKQGVEILHQRLRLGWEPPLEPLGPPFVDRRDAGAEPVQRFEPDLHLDGDSRDQRDGQDAEREGEGSRERRGRRGQLRLVHRGGHSIGARSVGECHGALQCDQPLPLRPGDPMAVDRAVRRRVGWQAERDIPQRPRTEDRSLRVIDLPVEAGVRFAESRIVQLMRQHDRPRARTLQRCGDLLELDRQLSFEPAFDVGPEEGRQECAGHGQGEQDPDDRAGEQPQTQRVDGDHPGSSSR